MSSRYVELLGNALRIQPSPTDYLGDIDSSFYVTGYLRSWALQAQLRSHFRDRFGSAWFSNRDAGSMLRELWSEGSRLNADELLADVAGEELEWNIRREPARAAALARAKNVPRGHSRDPVREERRRPHRLPGARRRADRPRLRPRSYPTSNWVGVFQGAPNF